MKAFKDLVDPLITAVTYISKEWVRNHPDAIEWIIVKLNEHGIVKDSYMDEI